MSGRGVYRSIFSALFDDPDFQRLSAQARHTLLTLRLCSAAGPAAIFRYYPELLCHQTGYSAKTLEAALQELEREGWIIREGVVLWIRNGFRDDPTIRLADPKHRKSVEPAVAALPKLNIALTFCDYYRVARPFEGPSDALARPLEDPSSPNPIPNPNPKRKKDPKGKTSEHRNAEDGVAPAEGPSPPPFLPHGEACSASEGRPEELRTATDVLRATAEGRLMKLEAAELLARLGRRDLLPAIGVNADGGPA